jgi:hypothetical protein
VSSLTFAQPARRGLTIPILIAVALLAIAAAIAYRIIPHTDADARITHVIVHPTHVVLKSQTGRGAFKILKQQNITESDLYIIPTLHIDDHLGVPLFLKDFHVVVETPSGQVHASAVEQNDLSIVYNAFPEIEPLMGTPLLRETSVAPKHSVDGNLLLHFTMPQSVWDGRQSAALTIDFYHQDSITIPFPKP